MQEKIYKHGKKINKLQKILLMPTAIVASGIIVGIASHSTFLAEKNTVANFESTIIDLNSTHDENLKKLFDGNEKIEPGSTGSECVEVTGNIEKDNTKMTMRVANEGENNIDDHLNLTITKGTQSTYAKNCAGFTPDTSAAIKETLTGLKANDEQEKTLDLNLTKGKKQKIVYKFDYEANNNLPQNEAKKSDMKVKFALEK